MDKGKGKEEMDTDTNTNMELVWNNIGRDVEYDNPYLLSSVVESLPPSDPSSPPSDPPSNANSPPSDSTSSQLALPFHQSSSQTVSLPMTVTLPPFQRFPSIHINLPNLPRWFCRDSRNPFPRIFQPRVDSVIHSHYGTGWLLNPQQPETNPLQISHAVRIPNSTTVTLSMVPPAAVNPETHANFDITEEMGSAMAC
ncbi:hypothetical protein PanWU01x14_234350 [Parasponia andersonii]|uniref:Uncharacterized protein n=1 Tax=Parasponia andersonii TaxID=3476 RepID=A0A2P5BIV5_PARAD|nr:hypothetical protein PanWU01x14_234350 [Parasponia andersonii]